MPTLHTDDLPVDEALVRRLVRSQQPEYSDLPVTRLAASGSTNVLFRLGDDLLVRVPRQPGGSATIVKEARWVPHVAQGLPVPTPEVVFLGRPGHGYPERWSVVRWLPGERPAAMGAAPTDSGDQLARDLAAVVSSLRETPVPSAALEDPALRWYRAEPLTAMDAQFRADVESCRALGGLDLDLDAALQVWEAATALGDSRHRRDVRWLHGDLVAENLLVADGRLAGVLDFGGLAVGDPAVDLVVGWELLDVPARAVFREALGIDDDAWLVGRGWALALAMMTFAYYWASMPDRCATRLAMARAALVDAQTLR